MNKKFHVHGINETHYLHEIQCVNLVHHIHELNGMNEIEKTMQILKKIVSLFTTIFEFYPCEEKWPKMMQTNLHIIV
jgi:hypothetical protein